MTTTEHVTNIISPRPPWAGETQIDDGGITHTWTAPTVALGSTTEGGPDYPIPVELMRYDELTTTDEGVSFKPGQEALFLLDTNIPNPQEGRLLAAAILEACDRWDGAR